MFIHCHGHRSAPDDKLGVEGVVPFSYLTTGRLDGLQDALHMIIEDKTVVLVVSTVEPLRNVVKPQKRVIRHINETFAMVKE
tara:strand:+ start:579 stop:824 length:246 start_codon:yes stop_codon:yes gene_type:complete